MNNVYTPPPSGFHPDKPQTPEDNGSLGTGIGLAWAIAVVGTPLCIAIVATLNIKSSAFALALLPYLLIVVLAILQYRKGKPRTGLGLMLGLLSIIAVALLLVAACFGLLSNLNTH